MPSLPSIAFHIQAFAVGTALLLAGCAQLSDQTTTGVDKQPAVRQVAEVANQRPTITSDGSGSSAQNDEPNRAILTPTDMDLWQRLREGFAIAPTTLHPSVEAQRDWYLENPSYLETVFARAQPYIFYVTAELDKAGLPLELALLPIVESTYDPLAYSHSHAVGLWQFIPSTAKSLGLRRDRWYDGRRDVISSTQAAITYLSNLNGIFDDDWLLALAAYNSGQGYVGRSMARNRASGKETDFWSIDLPRETRNYVPQLLALAELIGNPEKYELQLPEMPNQPYFEVVEIDSQIDLGSVIKLTDTDVAEFTRLNPAYRRALTPPTGSHTVLLPIGNADPLREFLASTDPKTWIPHTEYTVTKGDTLSQIASRFKVPTQWLRTRNDLTSDQLKIGQLLLIPHAGDDSSFASTSRSKVPNYYHVRQGDSLWSIAKASETSIKRLREINKLSSDTLQVGDRLLVEGKLDKATNTAGDIESDNLRRLSYRVKRGDSLSRIASRFDIAIRDIRRWNKLSQTALLQPGQRLTLFIDGLKI